MSKATSQRTSSSNILTGAICLIVGGALQYFDQTFFAWLLFAVGASTLFTGLLQPRVGHDAANNIGLGIAILVAIAGIYTQLITTLTEGWSLALAWGTIAILSFTALYGFSNSIKSLSIRLLIKPLGLMALGGTLALIFHLFGQNFLVLEVLILYLATDYLRRALYELLVGNNTAPSSAKLLFVIPDILVLSLLALGYTYYQDGVFFHLISLSLVLATLRFSTEVFIPEIAIRERKKLDEQGPVMGTSNISFFRSVTGTHSSVNFIMLPLLFITSYLPIDEYLFGSDTQSVVFQVTTGLIGLVIAFSTIILSNRAKKDEPAFERQSYLLNGLFGVIVLLVIISLLSFLGMVVNNGMTTQELPSYKQLVAGIWTDNGMRIVLLVLLINEFVFFAIPATLAYFLSINHDFNQRFNTDS